MKRSIISGIGGLAMLLAACAGDPEGRQPIRNEPGPSASTRAEQPTSLLRFVEVLNRRRTNGGCQVRVVFNHVTHGVADMDHDRVVAAADLYRNSPSLGEGVRQATASALEASLPLFELYAGQPC